MVARRPAQATLTTTTAQLLFVVCDRLRHNLSVVLGQGCFGHLVTAASEQVPELDDAQVVEGERGLGQVRAWLEGARLEVGGGVGADQERRYVEADEEGGCWEELEVEDEGD